MIQINLAVRNPWSRRYRILFCKFFELGRRHMVEFTAYHDNCLFDVGLHVSGFRQDHAGFGMHLGLLGHVIEFDLYNKNHWEP